MLYLNEINNYKEIKSYYPNYYDDILEMQEIFKANGRLLDKAQQSIEIVLDNNFIRWADEITIDNMEKRLGIQTKSALSLEKRRKIVQTFLAGNGKISESKIKEMAKIFSEDDVQVEFKVKNSFAEDKMYKKGINELYINAENGFRNSNDRNNFLEILKVKIPAHIKCNLFLERKSGLKTTVTGEAFTVVHSFGETYAGLHPDVSVLVHRKELAIIGNINKKAYKSKHEFSGTKPNISTTYEKSSSDILCELKKENYKSIADCSGTKPEINTFFEKSAEEILCDLSHERYRYPFDKTSEDKMLVSRGDKEEGGLEPEISVMIKKSEHQFCGTTYCGEGG